MINPNSTSILINNYICLNIYNPIFVAIHSHTSQKLKAKVFFFPQNKSFKIEIRNSLIDDFENEILIK